MVTKVTAEDWDKVFQNGENQEPKRALTKEVVLQMALASAAMVDLLYSKYQAIKDAEHIPAKIRVHRIIEIVESLHKLHDQLDYMMNGLLKDVMRTSNVLIQCELMDMIRKIYLVDELIFANKKTKAAHKDLYGVIKRQTQIENIDNIRSMLRVGTLSEQVRNQLHGTPLAQNLSFMRMLRPDASNDWNLSQISGKLEKLNKKIRQESQPRLVPEEKPEEKPNQCNECGDWFNAADGGFCRKRATYCKVCWEEIKRLNP